MLWAVLRSESAEQYRKLLTILKTACESLMPDGADWKPSCCLVDNSDAECKGARCVPLERTESVNPACLHDSLCTCTGHVC